MRAWLIRLLMGRRPAPIVGDASKTRCCPVIVIGKAYSTDYGLFWKSSRLIAWLWRKRIALVSRLVRPTKSGRARRGI